MPNEAKWGDDLGPEGLPVRGKLALSLQLWRGGRERKAVFEIRSFS